MFKKIFKNKKGSALVFAMILISNAIIIVSSIVFISAIQNRASGTMALTPVAFQQADSGLEYLLRQVNHSPTYDTDTIDDICETFDDSEQRCSFDNSTVKFSAYFLDENEEVLDKTELIKDAFYVNSFGGAGVDGRKISRSLKTTLFDKTKAIDPEPEP